MDQVNSMMTRRCALVASVATTAFAAATGGRAFAWSDNAHFQSISCLRFTRDGKLLVADWRSDSLHAVILPSQKAGKPGSFNVKNLSTAIRNTLELKNARFKATAVAYDSVNHRAIIGIEVEGKRAVLIEVSQDGRVQPVAFSIKIDSTFVFKNRPTDEQVWKNIPARSFLVTDMLVEDNEVYVAGLANSNFDSTLTRLPYPFNGTSKSTRIEMYHTVHNQFETRAPIRAMCIVSLAGEKHLVAAYTCTPLVTVPIGKLDGGKVRAKTIAELGFGNAPLNVIPFEINYQGNRSNWIVVANAAKSADLISLNDIEEANGSAGITEPVKVPFQSTSGVPAIPLPMTNLVGLVDQDTDFLLALRCEPESGELELVSYRKGAFFRLSDFVNEYDFSTYQYAANDPFQQEYVRPFHKMMKSDEGYGDLVK